MGNNILVFGISGHGKSTFLNHLALGPDFQNELFISNEGGNSGTLALNKQEIKIYGTQTKLDVIDSPGIAAADLQLGQWLSVISKAPNFKTILWVIKLAGRVDPNINLAYNLLKGIVSNFKEQSVIIVFTFCDTLQKTTKEEAKDTFFRLQNIRPFENIIYFGKRLGPHYPKRTYCSDLMGYLNQTIKSLHFMSIRQNFAVSSQMQLILKSYKLLPESGNKTVRNKYYGGYLYAANWNPFDCDRRRVFCWPSPCREDEWELKYYNNGDISFRNTYHNEYLYAADSIFDEKWDGYNKNKRQVLTWRKGEKIDNGYWQLSLGENGSYYIINSKHGGYLYAGTDFDGDRRKVFVTYEKSTSGTEWSIE